MSDSNNLELLFNNGAGANSKIIIKNPIADLSASTIQAAQQVIVDSKLFSDEGIDEYAEAEGARYIQ